MKNLLHILLATCLVLLATTAGATARSERLRFEVAGHTRYVDLVLPDRTPPAPAPLVLVLHGYSQTVSGFRRVTRASFDRFGPATGAIIAYPNAIARDWNAGIGLPSEQVQPPRDDLAFLTATIEAIATRTAIDRNRIFIAGSSLGAILGYALACDRPGLIRAVAAINMPLLEVQRPACAGTRPFSLLTIQGSEDRLAPGGAWVITGSGPIAKTLTHAESLALALERAGCRSQPDQVQKIDAKDDGTRVLRRDWSRCAPGHAVRSYDVIGGGHTWPGGKLYAPFMGRISKEFDAAEAALEFFDSLR